MNKKLFLIAFLVLVVFVSGCLNSGPEIKIEKILRCVDEPSNLIKDFCNKQLSEEFSGVQGVKTFFVGLGLNSMKCQDKKISVNCAVKIYTAGGKTILDDSIDLNDIVEDCDKKKPEEVKAVCYGFLNDLHLTNVETTYFFDFQVEDKLTGKKLDSVQNKLIIQPVKNFNVSGLTFVLPENWILQDLNEATGFYKFSSPKSTLFVQPLNVPADAEIPTFSFDTLSQAKIYENYSLIKKDSYKIDRRETDFHLYTFSQGGQNLTGKDFLVLRGRKAWLIGFSALQEEFEEQEKELQEFLDSIRIVG